MRVVDESAIGAILPCPNCGSMVEITPPQPQQVEPTTESTEPGSDSAKTIGPPPIPRATEAKPPQNHPATPAVPPPPQTVEAEPLAQPPFEPDQEPTAGAWESSTETLWRQRLLMMGGGAAAVVLILALVAFLTKRKMASPPPEPSPAVETVATLAESKPDESKTDPAELAAIPIRWIPDRATRFFQMTFPPQSLDGANPTAAANRASLEKLAPYWKTPVADFLTLFPISTEQIDRLTWITDQNQTSAEASNRALILLRLTDTETVDRFLADKARPMELKIDGWQAVRLLETRWADPIVRVGKRMLVTGPEAVLRQLADRTDATTVDGPLRSLLPWSVQIAERSAGAARVIFLADWSSIRSKTSPSPVRWFDIWPEVSGAWRTVCEPLEAIGLLARLDAEVGLEANLIYADPSTVQRATSALPQWIEAAKARVKEIDKTSKSPLLSWAQTVLAAARWESRDDSLLVATDLNLPAVRVASTLSNLSPKNRKERFRTVWNQAAANEDRAHVGRLGQALQESVRSEGHYPPGVLGSGFFPPETRLSWVADMLPYLGHPEWRAKLKTGYSWNSRENRPVTRRHLPELINPSLGPTTDAQGYPVTHYVGVAGIGPDAATLPATDPRAGLFGYRREVRPDQITDGRSNTIALLEVDRDPGPWAAGGRATVRALTQEPYINGPDGFGSGRPDGLFAMMADGSVRFFSKDTDPKVLEQLATIAGHEPTPETKPTSKTPAIAPSKTPATPPIPAPSKTETAAEILPARPAPIPAEPQQPAVPRQEIEARLALPVEKLQLDKVRLIDFLTFFEEMTAIKIELDENRLALWGATRDDQVSVRVKDTTLGETLRRGLQSIKLDFQVVNGKIVIIQMK